ncbi:uncharacterized protein ISCGN_005847 [Ixodes scapularis]
MFGSKVRQLVLPSERRREMMRLVHESFWGGHLGTKKTKLCIKYSFYWPDLEREVMKHCKSCHGCHIRWNTRRKDRVPITLLACPEHLFEVVNVDIIGTLCVLSARGHRYAICMADICTHWPEVVCLRSLTAKATCEVLLEVFNSTGEPQTVCCDEGTNFTTKLTQQML